MTERIDFKSMTPEELTAWCKDQGQPAFRGKQLFQWLSRGVASTEEMTDVPKALRAKIDQAVASARRWWPGSRSQSWTAP